MESYALETIYVDAAGLQLLLDTVSSCIQSSSNLCNTGTEASAQAGTGQVNWGSWSTSRLCLKC
eukprot:CAMPEP_0119113468 /NCGR_PEP_ID=MMETSP1180-20130426/44047_1 /TAXON_ID=3052 ORGANISM="Chlamydomonas cf sp, Strain CCMP681" /NCGR_SAMPLE_ID=MMETSP1180 /ASSEMBLY_ACC=CAM_ASM_000741 /LENGTH=63 /DNA_ID=CAMNT_0007101563 /DNA_START=516 /DNA_END=704 /DNA_ORIENTATION=+